MPTTARRLANELEDLNRERQAVEGRIFREAAQQVEGWPDEQKARRAYVVAGENWHEGVIGIVASRLVERFNRPVVLIAGTDGDWKGSGRSIPSFDLHGALGACSSLLGRWGGHRAAAGLVDQAREHSGVRGCVRGACGRPARRRRSRGRRRTSTLSCRAARG